MRRLTIVAGLCVIAIVVLPAAAASAFRGACEIKGTATIFKVGTTEKQALPVETPAPRSYKFQSEGEGACVNAEGEPIGQKVTNAKVEGKGELSCARSSSAKSEGKGEIAINGKVDVITEFGFVGVGVNVTFEALGEKVTGIQGVGPARGNASFAADTKGVKECGEGKATELKFTAVTSGEFK